MPLPGYGRRAGSMQYCRKLAVTAKKRTIMKITLETICNKYCKIESNADNFGIGGGLDGVKFASRRHEDAKNDSGKLTLGKATQLFKSATGFEIDKVREVIKYAVPNMEWHHAGKLPKNYGGGMKKTYFVNAAEICKIASNFFDYAKKLEISKAEAKIQAEQKKSIEQKRFDFLKENAKYVTRVTTKPPYFHETLREMRGKYGWFDSTYKSYNLPEYFSGWVFESAEKLQEFYLIKQ